jgi:predicted HAD superfamily Cof-like phosphohydrolase
MPERDQHDHAPRNEEMAAEFYNALPWPVRDEPTTAISSSEVRLLKDLIQEESDEFAEAADAADLDRIADSLADIVYVAYGAARHYGFSLDPIIEVVHEANMSKRREDGTFELDERGKVLRGPDYREPDIRGALHGQHNGSRE